MMADERRKRKAPARLLDYQVLDAVLLSDNSQQDKENEGPDDGVDIDWSDYSTSDEESGTSDDGDDDEVYDAVDLHQFTTAGDDNDGDGYISSSRTPRSSPEEEIEQQTRDLDLNLLDPWIEVPFQRLRLGAYLENELPPYQFDDFRETCSTFDFRTKNNEEIGLHFDVFGANLPNELQCFECMFNPDIREDLVKSINEFAQAKIDANTPPTKRSRYRTWNPIDEGELYKFLAVITAMGIDKRPSIRDYWSDFPPLATPWYSKMFERERFEVSIIVYSSNSLYFSHYYTQYRYRLIYYYHYRSSFTNIAMICVKNYVNKNLRPNMNRPYIYIPSSRHENAQIKAYFMLCASMNYIFFCKLSSL